jgi:hypothetical protein
MTDHNNTEAVPDAVSSAASDAYYAARSAVLRVAEAQSAEIRERPAWPGAYSTVRYAEPLAGIRAAVIMQRAGGRVVDDYVRYARQDGSGWRDIGEALGLAQDGQRVGYDLAVAAYEHVTGEPDLFRDVSFYWRCAACEQGISDKGPYESHPEDNERGHADTCTRLAADVEAWHAEQDAWEAGQ